jgi:hypothetical protein
MTPPTFVLIFALSGLIFQIIIAPILSLIDPLLGCPCINVQPQDIRNSQMIMLTGLGILTIMVSILVISLKRTYPD